MKFRLSKKLTAVALANLLSLGCFAGFCVYGSQLAKKQSWSFAAERWSTEEDYSQVSCFFANEADFNVQSVYSLRNALNNSLENAAAGGKSFPDAYSSPLGRVTADCGQEKSSDSELTAVGGDFFLIHNFKLLDGTYFSDDDIMQDGAVIDRSLAWSLYGSENAAGMSIFLNGKKFYVSGVIDTPSSTAEKKVVGELPRAYISYSGASQLDSSEGIDDEGVVSAFGRVSCYEAVIPNPVENFASTALENAVEQYGENAEAVCISGRFAPMRRLKALKKITLSGVRENAVVLPFWENAARITEAELSFTYRRAALCLVIPVITLAAAIFRLIAMIGKKRIFKRIADIPLEIIEKRKKEKYERMLHHNEQENH